MSKNTIFISYSRKDSDFVTKFTKNLRDAGADLWLDKQIKPGGHWDASIESALETCQDFLLILSKNSVDSNNVMDEVSYALEEKKRVIPIKIEECDIPFRLRRIQHLDYYLDEGKSMEILLQALNLKSDTENHLETPIISKKEKTVTSKNPVVPKKEIVENGIKSQPKKTGFLKYIIGFLIVAVGIFYFMNSSDLETNVDAKPDSKSIITTISEPNTDSIATTISEVVTDAEDWSNINKSTNIEDFENHLKNYSECSHITEANNLIANLQEFAEDENEWKRAVNKNTAIDYLNYIMEFKKEGAFYKDALNKLDDFFISSGFVQFSSSSGELYFSIFENDTRVIPEVGDLIFAKTARNIHKGPYGSPKFGVKVHTSSKDEVFKVKAVKTSGTSYWIEVSF